METSPRSLPQPGRKNVATDDQGDIFGSISK
jgi:hypothetical protein